MKAVCFPAAVTAVVVVLPHSRCARSACLCQDKVHIPGAIYLSVKFDSRCHSEEGCDELIMSSSADLLQDLHTFSGSPQKWSDFEIPGTARRLDGRLVVVFILADDSIQVLSCV